LQFKILNEISLKWGVPFFKVSIILKPQNKSEMAKKNKKITEDVAEFMGISSSWINKFTIVTVLFIVWLAFFDKHNIFAHQKLKSTVSKLEKEKEKLNQDISLALQDREDLDKDIEKFAKEKHLMKKPGEEIILIETKKK
jgi:cell division protein DivIC